MNEVTDLLTGDLTNKENKLLRSAAYRIGGRIVGAAFIAFCFGAFGPIGVQGFVLASDLDNKIKNAVDPIKADVASIKQKLDTLANAATQQTLQTLRVQIVEAKEKQCKAAKSETATIYRQQVFAAQQQYWNLTQQNYAAPACSDL